jgi:isopenicillin-N epimerase
LTPFGRPARADFILDPDVVFLNNGSFGATPRLVLEAQSVWRTEMERQPVRFMARTLKPAQQAALTRLAPLIGADSQDIVFVENPTAAINAVLGSLHLKPGDRMLCMDHGYGAVRQTLRHVAARTGAALHVLPTSWPFDDGEAFLAQIDQAMTLGTPPKIMVLDAITSPSGIRFPFEEAIAISHRHGVPALIDGAHAPGMIKLDLTAINADWFTGTLHKWMFAAKGSAFLYARRDRQGDLHPTSISHFYGEGLQSEFAWTGTRDSTAWLALPAALDFIEARGAEAIRAYNRNLLEQAAALLHSRLGLAPLATPAYRGFLASFDLGPGTPAQALALHDELIDRHKIELPIMPLKGRMVLRISAQIFNCLEDYQALAAALEQVDYPSRATRSR